MMTAFYFSHSHTFIKHMYQHISTHKTHMYAMLTSFLLCICNFFHLFFLPPSCFSLSFSLSALRVDAGKLWIVFYFCAATSLTLFFLLCHSTRHVLSHGSFTPTDTGPESAASLSLPTFQSPSSSLSFQPRVYSEAGIGNSVLC